jgi:hypothetical protein
MAEGNDERQVASTVLVARMEQFASGTDVSLVAANAIESAIILLFPEDEELQELADLLAQYRPGGGDHLYSEAEMRPWVAAGRERVGLLGARTAESPPR